MVRPRQRSAATLGVFLEAMQGCRMVVELKRDMIVRGVLESVDDGLGLTLTDATFEDLQKRKVHWDMIHIRGQSVRYVHVPSKAEPDEIIIAHRRRIAKERQLLDRQALAAQASGAGIAASSG